MNKICNQGLIANLKLALASLLLIAPIAQSDEEAIARGEVIFNEIAGLGCKGCHGEFAEGDLGVGPYIRGATEGTIRAAIEGIDTMIVVKSTIDEQGIKDISAYIGSLGETQILRTLAKKGRFLPNTVTVAPNQRIQIAVRNASFLQARSFNGSELGVQGDLEIAPRTTGGLDWISPDAGEFKLWCENCDLEDEFFTVRVDPNLN